MKIDDLKYRFEGIALAQGHAANNNWWFGGYVCTNSDNNRVYCYGFDQYGEKYKFVFLRGGNDVNEVVIVSIEQE
ncbi:MAG: hypothetical protein LBD84_06000 [Campylobacteraceae bacterium]|nr:hypothetical protein [Campylobacteraceae bacterium]